MNRIDRLTAIILILQGGKHSASEIAAHFEVSKRTIQRDIQALSEMSVPIVADLGVDGGYSLLPDYTLPPLALTFHEALLMRLALSGLSKLGEAPFRRERESLLAKVETLMPKRYSAEIADVGQALTVDVPARPFPAPFLEMLVESAREQQWLAVTYRSERQVSEQTILPAQVRTANGLWYCEAYSHERGETRVYRVDRFLSAQVTAAPTSGADSAPLPNGHPSLPEVRLTVTPRGVMMMERDPNLGHLIERDKTGGHLAFHLKVQDYEWLTRLLLMLGPEAQVIAPDSLRQQVRQAAESITRHYAER